MYRYINKYSCLSSSCFGLMPLMANYKSLKFIGKRVPVHYIIKSFNSSLGDFSTSQEDLPQTPLKGKLTHYVSSFQGFEGKNLFPRSETRLRSNRDHHLNAICKELYTSGYYDIDFDKTLRAIKVVKILIQTKNEATEDPILFHMELDHILNKEEQDLYKSMDYTWDDYISSPILDPEDLKNLEFYVKLRKEFETKVIGVKNGKGNVHANNFITFINISFVDVDYSLSPVRDKELHNNNNDEQQ